MTVQRSLLLGWQKSGVKGHMVFSLLFPKNKLWKTVRSFRSSMSFCFVSHARQREQMEKRNGGKAVNQQYLFHGTDASLVEAICEQNFDWRMCGVHGTAYGKGRVGRQKPVRQLPTRTSPTFLSSFA